MTTVKNTNSMKTVKEAKATDRTKQFKMYFEQVDGVKVQYFAVDKISKEDQKLYSASLKAEDISHMILNSKEHSMTLFQTRGVNSLPVMQQIFFNDGFAQSVADLQEAMKNKVITKKQFDKLVRPFRTIQKAETTKATKVEKKPADKPVNKSEGAKKLAKNIKEAKANADKLVKKETKKVEKKPAEKKAVKVEAKSEGLTPSSYGSLADLKKAVDGGMILYSKKYKVNAFNVNIDVANNKIHWSPVEDGSKKFWCDFTNSNKRFEVRSK